MKVRKALVGIISLAGIAISSPVFAGNAHSTWCFHHPVACQEQNRHRDWDRDDRRRHWDNDRDDQWRRNHWDWDHHDWDRWEREHGRRSWNLDNHHEGHHDHDRD